MLKCQLFFVVHTVVIFPVDPLITEDSQACGQLVHMKMVCAQHNSADSTSVLIVIYLFGNCALVLLVAAVILDVCTY